MKQTIVAIININKYPNKETIHKLSNHAFVIDTYSYGNLLTLKEFEEAYNADEIDFEGSVIRIVEAELEVKSCK